MWRTLEELVASAEQTGYWHAGDTVVREPTFDVDQVDQLVKTIQEHNAAWHDWFVAFDIQPYENRQADELNADRITRFRANATQST
jgi:trehalose 2-sulfotransferase